MTSETDSRVRAQLVEISRLKQVIDGGSAKIAGAFTLLDALERRVFIESAPIPPLFALGKARPIVSALPGGSAESPYLAGNPVEEGIQWCE
jgi:hypothetical protein